MFADITAPVVLTFQLLRRFWPQLVALVLVGVLANDLLMLLAAKVSLANHMAGLALLTFVALAQLVVTVAIFQVLRPGLPAIGAAQDKAEAEVDPSVNRRAGGSRFAAMVTIAFSPSLLTTPPGDSSAIQCANIRGWRCR
jgi:hypothetical protein